MCPLGYTPLMLHFLLHNRPHCQAGTHSFLMFIVTFSYCLTVRDAGFFRATGFCSDTNICCSSSSKHLCTLHTGMASWRALSIFTFRAVKEIYPMVPVAVHSPCLANGNLPPLTIFQCYLVTCPPPPSLTLAPTWRGSQPHGTTCYLIATGFLHPVEPQAPLPAGYPANCANCLVVHTVCTVR